MKLNFLKHYNTIIVKDVAIIKENLEAGEVAGIPTETVYGLAANALNEDAVLKIFSVKNRPHFDPLIVHTHSKDEIKKYVLQIPEKAEIIIDQFMPGPVTVLLKKKETISDLITSGLDHVAIRIPNHPVTLLLLRQLEFPLAAPSANPFGYISPTTAQHVFDQMHGKIPYILDGGPAVVGVESTIIGFEGNEAIIYRPGGLAVEEIEKAIGRVKIIDIKTKGRKSEAPGMLASHYAPTKRTFIYEPGMQKIGASGNMKVGVIAFDKYLDEYENANQILLSPAGDINEAAKNLFSAMRKLDASDVDVIVAVKFPTTGLGRAINDRLKRASA